MMESDSYDRTVRVITTGYEESDMTVKAIASGSGVRRESPHCYERLRTL